MVHFKFPKSFTTHHQELLDICFGIYSPDPGQVEQLSSERLKLQDLDHMIHMVKVEFASSLEKEMKGPGGEDVTLALGSETLNQEPCPYDVFLMETTLERRENRLAVCIPRKDDLVWFNGDRAWPLDPPTHKWRVASLSGPARVLQALHNPTELTLMAMKAEAVISACDESQDWLDFKATIENEGKAPEVKYPWYSPRAILSSVAAAMDGSPEPGLKSKILQEVVKSCTEKSDIDGITQSMNGSQSRAIRTVTDPSFKEGFFVTQGPPGTGKTSVIVGMILAMNQNVLVTAPSNAAVANVAKKLFETGMFKISELTVFGENCDPSVRFLNPIHRGREFSKMMRSFTEEGVDAARREKVKGKFIEWLRVSSQNSTTADLAEICPYLDMDSRHGRLSFMNMLRASKVVFSTINSTGSMMLRSAFSTTTIIVDEGGQCPEAEFYIATTFPNAKRVVVVGDPKQLPSTVINPLCLKAGYGRSWLGRVFQILPQKIHLLDTQYRMDPQILRFPNHSFYENRILSGDSVINRPQSAETPFQFIDTDNKGKEEKQDTSWQNVYEATLIKVLLATDPDIKSFLVQADSPRIIVITPYRAQVRLLRESLESLNKKEHIEVATVDSFQGQEADIVIVSTVRTHRVGFVDCDERLNVALTRAKFILRVVGDASFFLTLGPSSILRNLVQYATRNNMVEKAKVRAIPWSRPNWKQPTLWKPACNQRFLHCLKSESERNKNIFLNTLHAIAKPDYTSLMQRVPNRERAWWYITNLRGYPNHHIVWIAKMRERQPSVEAYFAGTHHECLKFTQIHPSVPEDACLMSPDLSRIQHRYAKQREEDEEGKRRELWAAWPMTNTIQKVIYRDQELPVGSVQLDHCQEEVARSNPPLLIESRSGTGKTLVLLQHAAYFANKKDITRPALFVTVSRGLRDELHRRYNDMSKIENSELPRTMFFSFSDLIHSLLRFKNITDFDGSTMCTFQGYVVARKSHERIAIEPHLIENEIGGVILGSLSAAKLSRPLLQHEYLAEGRSNIENSTDHDKALRKSIYEEYFRYHEWKIAQNRCDLGDVVLRLLQEDWEQLFSSAYLDEIQDLPFASIYLICTIAGKDHSYWVCGGDPAQMISPGCSFTFDGLKQTLLAVQDGIEDKLSQVSNLLKNYRTSKEVLNLANEILKVGKTMFPNAIPFAKQEIAMKNLGLKVVICDWKTAFSVKVRLGANQALIFSCDEPNRFKEQATAWIGQHPFTLTALESKGLEFDDVIVAFDVDRKVWNVFDKRTASLNMIRELYVAVTRAQRRLVVLVKKGVPEMRAFFNSLDCKFQQEGAEMVLREFDKVTTPEMWVDRGRRLFKDGHFHMAAHCFASAGDQGWLHWSEGRHLEAIGLFGKAVTEFWKALNIFFGRKEYELILDISARIPNGEPWPSECNEIVQEALKHRPHYLRRFDVVQLSLQRGAWDELSTGDLRDESLSPLFMAHREHPSLHKLVGECSPEDRHIVESVLPLVTIDYFRSRQEYVEAIRVCLTCEKVDEAAKSSNAAISVAKQGKRLDDLPNIVKLWTSSPLSPSLEHYHALEALLLLFRSPNDAAAQGKQIMHFLGKSIVRFAVTYAGLDHTILYDFSQTDFLVDVFAALSESLRPLDIVHWFCDKNDTSATLQFISGRLKQWDLDEIYEIVHVVRPWPLWLLTEVHRKNFSKRLLIRVIASKNLTLEDKREFITLSTRIDPGILETTLGNASNKLDILSAILWCVDDLVPGAKKITAKTKSNKGNVSQAKKSIEAETILGIFSRKMVLAWSFGDPESGSKSKPSGPVHSELFDPVQCSQLLLIALGSVHVKDQNTMIQCFLKFDKKEYHTSILMLEQLLKRKFWKTALDLTAGCLGTRSLAERNLEGVISVWQTYASSMNRQGVGKIVPLFAEGHLLSTLLLLTREKLVIASANDWLFVAKKYGPAVASYVRRREGEGINELPNHDGSTCNSSMKSILQYHAQMRRELPRCRAKFHLSACKVTSSTSTSPASTNALARKNNDGKNRTLKKSDDASCCSSKPSKHNSTTISSSVVQQPATTSSSSPPSPSGSKNDNGHHESQTSDDSNVIVSSPTKKNKKKKKKEKGGNSHNNKKRNF